MSSIILVKSQELVNIRLFHVSRQNLQEVFHNIDTYISFFIIMSQIIILIIMPKILSKVLMSPISTVIGRNKISKTFTQLLFCSTTN